MAAVHEGVPGAEQPALWRPQLINGVPGTLRMEAGGEHSDKAPGERMRSSFTGVRGGSGNEGACEGGEGKRVRMAVYTSSSAMPEDSS